jgi:hypothetical protein
MKIVLIAASCCALGACAAPGSAFDTARPGATAYIAVPAAAAAATGGAATQVDMNTLEELDSCRRHVATGTRIATVRCKAKAGSDADSVSQRQAQHDLESMRRQQMYEEQARRSAIAEAARRRSAQ